jgi:hypothetical protein
MAIRHIYNFAGGSNELASANSWVLDNYTPGDLNGAPGDKAFYFSDVPGTKVTLDLSAVGNINASYCDFTDLNVVNGIIYADLATCTGQNDSGVIFKLFQATNPLNPAQIYENIGGGIVISIPQNVLSIMAGNIFINI